MLLSTINIDVDKIDECFYAIANELINNHVLIVGNSSYQISNVEFYYYNQECHRDENCHSLKSKRAKDRQLLNSKWYVHKKSINPKYKRKGIDFTIGDGTNLGGVLIKEVIRIEDNTKFTQSKFIDELISILNPTNPDHLIKMIEEEELLKFKMNEGRKKHNILKDKRVGLAKETYKNNLYAFRIKHF
ncbi:MAG: hypothetical protein U9Q61_06720 [Thermodesulfobacteriota bacterium]|nr:hypothetical protein [Thermodesulfobacteriota bacterium]